MFKKGKEKDNLESLQNLATLTSRKNGKNRFLVMNDMKKCKKKYGCSYEEYYYYRFDTLTEDERDTYITREKNQELIRIFNQNAKTSFWNHKQELYTYFKTYLKRDFLYLTGDNITEFKKYVEKHDEFIAKTDERKERNQIRKVVLTEHMKPEKVYESLLEKNLNILDEELDQNKKLKELYGKSINTIRFITLKNKGKVHITSAVLKIGHGSIVDNVYYGGMLAKVDLKTGIVITPGIDYRDHIYELHPTSNIKIIDFEIPEFSKLKEYVLNLALKVKDANYIAWDIALTKKGPVFIDASIEPTWYQFPEFMKDKTGKLPQMELLLGHKIELNEKRTK